MKDAKELSQEQESALEEALAQAEAQNKINFEMAIAKRNLLGNLTNWRSKVSTAREDKILQGRNKILNLVLA